MELISDPNVTQIELEPLDPSTYYIFKVIARTAAGDGPSITRRGATLLEGGEITATCFQYSTFQHSQELLSIIKIIKFVLTPSSPVPPSNITIVPSNTSLNLSWVPGERDRNHGFHIRYLRKSCKKRVEGSSS